jgi:hypothetical protein
MATSYSFSWWTNSCGDYLTWNCEITAVFKKNSQNHEFTWNYNSWSTLTWSNYQSWNTQTWTNYTWNNQWNNQWNGSQSSTSSGKWWSSGKSHKNEENNFDTTDTDYGKTFYELINNNGRENNISTKTNDYETIQSNQFTLKYISRSCKPYNIEYIQSLNAYTSPDLKKKEYFVNIDYFKRYVDSKNAQNAECYTNRSWITTSYIDTTNSNNRYIAPNWKIYFISQQNWFYVSNDINSSKNFTTIDELKNYIKKRNPLISM